jgi:hypothetical protein
MVQRVVPVPFSSPSAKRSDLRFPETEAGPTIRASDYPPDSVPIPQFVRMPEQDLSIWTPTRVMQALARVLAESLRPAELRPIRINKDDHA